MLKAGKVKIIRLAVVFTRLLCFGVFTKAGFCSHLCSINKGTKKDLGSL